MRILIITDVHNRVIRVKNLLNREKYDKVIFTGDWFDDFGDTYEDARLTAIFLKENLHNPNFIFLHGNHDVSYQYAGNPYVSCSGFEWAKNLEIHKVLNKEDWAKFKLFYLEQGILFSHAGLSRRLLKDKHPQGSAATLEEVIPWLETNYLEAISRLENRMGHFLYAVSYSRGGNGPWGGLTWDDSDIDFLTTKFNQIFGHTPHEVPLFYIEKTNGYNEVLAGNENLNIQKIHGKNWGLGLDTHTNHYAILEDGFLTINHLLWNGFWNRNKPERNELKSVVRIFKGEIK